MSVRGDRQLQPLATNPDLDKSGAADRAAHLQLVDAHPLGGGGDTLAGALALQPCDAVALRRVADRRRRLGRRAVGLLEMWVVLQSVGRCLVAASVAPAHPAFREQLLD